MSSPSPNGTMCRVFDTPSLWLEGQAVAQLEQVSRLPGALSVTGFPDLHPGRFGPVGMAALFDRLFPQLIGNDIGCGMSVYGLSLPARRFHTDKTIRRLSGLDTPMNTDTAHAFLTQWASEHANLFSTPSFFQNEHGFATLGGGNHFLEIQKRIKMETNTDLDVPELCLLIHTGSRAHGQATWLRAQNGPTWNEGWDPDSPHAKAWLEDHDRLVAWAAASRDALAQRAAQALNCDVQRLCHAPHNLVEKTESGWLHRKGSARRGPLFTPLAGSRDTESHWIVSTGDHHLDSLPHGCGRKRDRAAQHSRQRTGKSDRQKLLRNRFGGHVVCANAAALIEETGDAYKSPNQILDAMSAHDLGHSVATFQPLLTWKTETPS